MLAVSATVLYDVQIGRAGSFCDELPMFAHATEALMSRFPLWTAKRPLPEPDSKLIGTSCTGMALAFVF
jgi:hypothetical protein